MNALPIWIACGFAGLFLAACLVAWYEHLGRRSGSGTDADWLSVRPQVLTVDVELDTLGTPVQPHGDAGERRSALGSAIARMAMEPSLAQGFGDTEPMVVRSAATRSAPGQPQRDSAAAK